jgi:uncharacterized protein (DUF1800 family)
MQPLDAAQWDVFNAAHLLNRGGFGGSPSEIDAFYRLGFPAALDRFLNWQTEHQSFPLPEYHPPETLFQMTAEGPFLGVKPQVTPLLPPKRDGYQDIAMLRRWWLERMRQTQNPLREKMTLFWHGHFATGNSKVGDPFFMWQQNEMLRHHALGNFGELTKAISRDPAMMSYLDLRNSQRAHPNENFARELMELFTLGIGHYTEDDMKQSARAFTGYRVSSVDKISFQFVPQQHDNGLKKFLGQEGNFSGDDIINIILQQPACAEFIVRKLWRFLAGPEPSDATVKDLAATFRNCNYEITPLVREILGSREFYSGRVKGHLIKSPVQWLLQTAKSLEVQLPPDGRAAGELAGMGQALFDPPNVKGWDGGQAWINTNTLLHRYNFAAYFLRGGPPDSPYATNFQRLVPAPMRNDRPAIIASAAFRLYQRPLAPDEFRPILDFLEKRPRIDDYTLRTLYNLLMSTPQYQLC